MNTAWTQRSKPQALNISVPELKTLAQNRQESQPGSLSMGVFHASCAVVSWTEHGELNRVQHHITQWFPILTRCPPPRPPAVLARHAAGRASVRNGPLSRWHQRHLSGHAPILIMYLLSLRILCGEGARKVLQGGLCFSENRV